MGLGEYLGKELEKQGQQWVGVEAGLDFRQLSHNRYQIAPNNPEHYQRLLSAVSVNNLKINKLQINKLQINKIIHLWTYSSCIGEISSLESLEEAQNYGVHSLLSLIKALSNNQRFESNIDLLVVSSNAQFISDDEEIAYEKSPLLGLVKVIGQEIPGVTSRHVDLTIDQPGVNAKLILQEMQEKSGESEVAYRHTERWIPRLEKVDFDSPQKQDFAFKSGGMYLISGGNGGIGVEIAKYLLKHYNARLLLIGRTKLADIGESDTISEKISADQELEQLGGEIIYESVDVCDLQGLQQVVADAESRWGCQLDGVLHLAGSYQERSLISETQESWTAALRSKVGGAWVLNQLLKDYPQAVSINFSSVSSFLAGANVGSFVAANQFLQSFAQYQRVNCGLKSYCFSWSLWDDIGISRDNHQNKLASTKGYCPISVREGLYSLLIGLHHQQMQLFIGLDGSNRYIRSHVEDSYPLEKLTAYFTTKSNSGVGERLSELVVRDRFGRVSNCNFVQLEKMPLTQTGIIDREKLTQGDLSDRGSFQAQPATEIERQVARIWQEVLGLEEVGIDDNFFELGGHSLLLVKAQSKLEESFRRTVSIVDMFKYPSISTLAKYLSEEQAESASVLQGEKRAQVRSSRQEKGKSDIAVIGMSCRFPGANNIDEFWENLCNGVESISFFSESEVIATGVDPALVKNPNYVKAKPILSDVESFDADFFGYSNREAELIDPQQRLLLECAWNSLEDAGYNPLTYDGAIGIYAGAVMNTYLLNNIYPNRHRLDANDNLQVATTDSMGGLQMMVANDKDYLTTRISYKLNLTGPSVNVQTACSTSLVAIHMACANLLSGESDMALAGGVSVQAPQKIGHLYQDGMIVSPDGHCRAFDARAQGTIFGNGVGIVVLKRLEDAIADRDHIYAVVKGSAVNNDGGTKVGYMAPNGDGQASVVTEAMAMAGVDADTINYVEAHGTGTPLGDPIEIGGLTQAFRASTQEKNFCAIGSVKTNVGHLQIASGVVGFMKSVLSLYHQKIPPSLHFEEANPQLDLPNTPFKINTTLLDWQAQDYPRRAGVNSLGIGGTNAHVILEEAPEIIAVTVTPPCNDGACGDRRSPVNNQFENQFERPYHLLTISAKTEDALAQLRHRYWEFLRLNPEISLADVCYSANTGREHFNHRLAVVAESKEQLVVQLGDVTTEDYGVKNRRDAEGAEKRDKEASVILERVGSKRLKIAFLFTGQGSQYVNMGRELYESQPLFRQTLHDCDRILRPFLQHSLLEVLYPSQAGEEVLSLLNQTAYTQPALFAFEYALYQLWKSWGIEPDVVMGHSVGEYVAATVAGVFSLEDGLKLIAQRGQLMQQLPSGGEMVSLIASEEKAKEIIAPYHGRVAIAAINGPESVVISGVGEDIGPICQQLSTWEIWGALFHGGKLVIIPLLTARSPESFYKLLVEQKVTVLNQTPSAFRQLIQVQESVQITDDLKLRLVIFGGEALEIKSLQPWFERHGDKSPQLVNMYGITETTVHVTYRPLSVEDLNGTASVIGDKIPDLQVYVLDRHLQPVPVGIPGEMYIGGAGVARGYLNRDELTAQRFISNPFNHNSQERLYKSGDLARYLPNGELEYLGRIDHQVKVRGFRIELGEIEAVLNQCPIVGETTVIAREDNPDDKRLVAYIVPNLQQAFTVRQFLRLEQIGELNNQLKYELPNNMVIVHLNQNETEFVYQEIFAEESYLRHGITIKDGDCIFDVGANIGLFSLFAAQHCHNPIIYAFEPIPPVFEVLRLNCELYGLNVRLFDCGLSSTIQTDEFTYYPNVSVISGRFADEVAERETINTFLQNQITNDSNQVALSNQEIDELLKERLTHQRFNCHLDTISHVINQNNITQIDLLKIDVEKSELEVLGGIEEKDWNKIKQIVVEVHDIDGQLEVVKNLLKHHGFEFTIEQDSLLESTSLYNIYAVRQGNVNHDEKITEQSITKHKTNCTSPHQLTAQVRSHLKSKLPEYMVPNAFVILDSLPLTENGKIDRRALPVPELSSTIDKFIAPRTPTEEILAIVWAEVLKVKQVGIHDNFFELGGHSLLATQLISRIRTHLQVELPLRILFGAPTVAELAHEIEQLQQLEKQLNSPPIYPRDSNASNPLSFAQTRLWFLDQLQPNSAFYNMPVALRLLGNPVVSALEQSLKEIIDRHEALRTNFITVDGQPTQIIHAATPWTLAVVDLQSKSDNEQAIATSEFLRREAIQPFDLENQPLVRATLLVLSPTEHILSVCMHHIISDGWSMGVFIEELAALYNAYAQGKESPLSPLPVQYADFALWQRNWLQGDVLQTQLTYWQKQLAHAPLILSLPTDRPRKAVQTFKGRHEEFSLSAELSSELTALSQQQGVTLFMTLLTAFDTLLYRYTGTEDILVGTPIANRNRPEIEGLIGFFVNTLVLRTDLSDNPSFCELLTRVRQMSLEAYAHQDLPFEMLVEALQPERDLSHTPLFQVMFAFENTPMSEVKLTGLNVSPLAQEITTAKFDLTLSMQNTVNGLVGVWEYNTDLFDDSTIERMTDHFMTLLSGIVANPKQRIAQLPLLTEFEQQQLLVEWNNTECEYPASKCIHQLFEEQVEKTPNAVAVVYENQQLTYYELNTKANQLAHHLQLMGVGADTLVGICFEREPLMIVAILGILKAGGAYVPIDPNYPQERLSFILEDTSIKVLLTQEELKYSIPQHQARVVCLDSEWEKIAQNSESNPQNVVKPDNLAYIIYTSGSTGKPKGVLINHLNVVRLFSATKSWYNFNSSDVFTQFHSIAFDFSVWEIWGALLHGGKLVIIPLLTARSSESFYKLLVEEKVTVLNQTPSAFRQLIQVQESVQIAEDLKLRLVIFGGEALEIKSLQPWFERYGDKSPQLVNMYGITETTVHVTYCPLTIADLNNTASVIGDKIPDLQLYLLDRHLQPVPIGVRGEMYVGGAGLARGYLNRPELTQQKFISNPFQSSDSQRLYKTGDLARYLPSGKIEYLGRIDNQVKIRGFRIELGEIETVLSSHPLVNSVVAIAREDIPGDQRLVAYIVPQKEVTLTINELRSHLKSKLPEYMVPNAIVILESLPLTENGKIDRRALPVPELSSELIDAQCAPRTAIEEILAIVWAEVLKVKQVGIHDNFFTLGGHSLLATQLISRIRSYLQVELPLRILFGAPTVAELASEIEQLQQQEKQLISPPIYPRDSNASNPLSFAQTRLWFLDRLQPQSAFYNMPVALRLQGTVDVRALEQSLSEIIHRHEALRTNFITVDGQPTQIINSETNWKLSVVEKQHLEQIDQEIATSELLTTQAFQPFDLGSESLVRINLLVLSPTEHILIVCMHHIISDGWSMGVFVEELVALYNAYSQGKESPLAPLPVQYADFALWQRNWLQGDVLQTQLGYWQKQLTDAPLVLSLPTDRSRPAVQTTNGAHQQFALPIELSQKLTELSQQQGVTLFMTLLAAFDTLVYRYTGTEDILVGTPIANRNRSEIEGLIGFFVNTLVLRTDLSENPSFSELLTRVRAMALEAYAHQDLPFEMLVEALQPQRDLSHTPLFQVMFVLQNAPSREVELTGLTISPLAVENTTAKFDLTLSMQNTANGLVGVWEYNTDLFDRGTIERMTGHFMTLLSGIVANPKQRINQLPLLTESEQQQLLVDWNNTECEYATSKCIHQLFEEQVEKTPNAVAVVFQNQHLTYQQLNSKANQLAHYLCSQGVEAESLVGLCLERSLEMVVGILGILKAGGAYVPIDPEYPQERITFMLEDTSVKVLLTQSKLVESVGKYQGHLVCLDGEWQEICHCSEENPITDVQLANLAYVIYTSGTTGQPKGVMVTHSSLCNHMLWMQETFSLTNQDKVLQKTPFGFDASVWEFYAPLLVGGVLVMAENGGHKDAAYLLKLIVQQQITTIQLVPSLLQMLLETGGIETCNSLKQVFCGGEALPIALTQDLLSKNDCTLYNLYGPSEACIDTTFFNCNQNKYQQIVPIGKAIANVEIYILDQHCQSVPIGVPGELHIGGAGLARGYLNRPELTQKKFIPNPFSNDSNSRLYKTGDLARYLPDGNIEYLGRIDNQVKIRGFRIELGEIETVLSSYPHVQTSVAIVREDIPGNKRLVAYIVPEKQVTPTISELRQYLKAKLPEYMVPNAIVILESLPLTPNGKVDHRALPVPSNSSSSDTFISPRNSIELQLTQIWSKILKLDNVGVKDNFFDLGGHSLLAPYLITQIKQQLDKDISLTTFFQHPTIEQLATVVQKDTETSDWSPLVPIVPTGSNPPLFCLSGAGGYPFYLYNLARSLGSDQPFYTFQSNHLDSEQTPINRVEDIAAQYIEAMQTVQPQGPYFLAGHSFGGKVVYEIAQQLVDQGEVVALIAILDTTAPNNQDKPEEWDDARWLIDIARVLKIVFAKNLDMDGEQLLSLAPHEQLKYVLEYLQMIEILPPDADITYVKQLLQAFKTDGSVEYLPQKFHPIPITLFRASEAYLEENIIAQSKLLQDSTWGWSAFSNEVDIQFVPGNHITMMTQPHVQVLGQRLEACIKQAMKNKE